MVNAIKIIANKIQCYTFKLLKTYNIQQNTKKKEDSFAHTVAYNTGV
jgi:hypothetical protein